MCTDEELPEVHAYNKVSFSKVCDASTNQHPAHKSMESIQKRQVHIKNVEVNIKVRQKHTYDLGRAHLVWKPKTHANTKASPTVHEELTYHRTSSEDLFSCANAKMTTPILPLSR